MNATVKVIALLSVVVLTACQTAGGIGADVNPDEANLTREVMSEACVISRTKGANSSSRKADMEAITVMSIRDRHDGWRAADVAYRSFRDNIYFHTAKGQVICGGKNWEKFTTGVYQPSDSKFLQARADYRPESNGMERAIAVHWEGYAELFAGTIREIGNGAKGIVAITLPNNDGECTGGYEADSRTTGTWSIACTNGLSANGTFTAFGKGKGASGTGSDMQGRKVSYTMGGAT